MSPSTVQSKFKGIEPTKTFSGRLSKKGYGLCLKKILPQIFRKNNRTYHTFQTYQIFILK